MTALLSLLPPDLPVWAALALVGISFVTSAVTAALGLGGGMLLIAAMAQVMPVAALVPVHGAVQLGSNAGRALVLRSHIHWPAALWFCAGAVLGAGLGGALAVQLPADGLRLALGLFLLWVVWGPRPRFARMPHRAMAAAGALSTGLSMVFGATGPIGGAVLSALDLPRHGFVATQGVTALVMHLFKIVAFGLLGFAFVPWAGLIAAMIASGFLGTLAGTRVLGRMPEERFRAGFRLVMTALAAILVVRGALGLAP
ncbi:TSUP family transporter [Stappia sp.]|uniref:TSUP family transporter n=1 Tax=Stappia sp. TaxID=1870903 RepID=UPI0032D988F4